METDSEICLLWLNQEKYIPVKQEVITPWCWARPLDFALVVR